MKKIYLMGLTIAFAMSVNAQTTVRLKNPSFKGGKQLGAAKPSSPAQVACTILSNTQYVAGQTMDLEFNYTASNTDYEWVDYIAITFPTGITPNSSPNATFPSSSSGGGTADLNQIAGQEISWGVNDDDGYGSIFTTSSGVTFTVNVTIDPSVTGNQVATFLASGDGYYYYGPAGDVNSSFIIYPAGAALVNMFTKIVQPSSIAAINNCGMTTDQIFARIVNSSNVDQSNITVNYSVNGIISTSTVIPGPIAVDDSVDILFPTPFDFTASDMYVIKAWTEQPGDINLANDTAAITISNSIPVALTSATYSNGCESVYEYGSVNKTWPGNGLPFQFNTSDVHSGVLAWNYEIGTANPAATYTAVNIYPCVDVVLGESYRISFWQKTDLTANGMSAVTTGTAQTISGTSTVLKAYATIVPGTWVKDSVDYVPTATETRYFSIRGKGTLSAISAVNVRIDDIMIAKITSAVGIKTNSSIEAISMFPNPTSGILNVTSIEVTSSIEVFNIIGEKVYSGNLVKGNNSIDLSSLSNGAYFVKMNTNNQVITKKVVLTK